MDNIVNEIHENAIDPDHEPLSACCGAQPHEYAGGLCSNCKEHTHFQVQCQICKGSGSIYAYGDKNQQIEEPCPVCDDGFIEV